MPAGPFNVAFNHLHRRATACQLYTNPKNGQRVDTSTLLTISWDPSCFSTAPRYVNINLLSSMGKVFSWTNVDAYPGSFNAQIDPSWWGSTPSIQLQIGIAASDTPQFLNPFAAGPVFTAINSNPTANSASPSLASGTRSAATATATPVLTGGYSNVALERTHEGLTGTRLALAVLLPILIAAAAIGGYVFFVRRREAFKRAAWAETIDKRMSRLSGDWQSMSAVGGARPSMQGDRVRTTSAHSKSMSMLAVPRPSAFTEPLPKHSTSIYDQHATVPFAAEDFSQLGPRARALSEAASAGRPISTAISVHSDVPIPPMPLGRSRSKSNAAESRPHFARNPSSHTRTLSTTSNNPYANAMVQRNSQALSVDGSAVAFPRTRLDSNGRSVDAAGRTRVTSRVSFAEVPHPSGDQRRNLHAEKQALRSSARNQSADFGIDFGDAYPALALMRVKSGEGLDAVAFPTGDSPLTPSREFLPPPKKTEYFDGMPNSGLGGRTPDEMLKAYAAAMGSEKEEPSSSNSGVVASLKKFAGLWRK